MPWQGQKMLGTVPGEARARLVGEAGGVEGGADAAADQVDATEPNNAIRRARTLLVELKVVQMSPPNR